MIDKREMQRYFECNKDKNYKAIVSKIENKEKVNKNKFLRIVATLIITIIGTMGVVYAATQIYNTYIKKDDNIDLRGLYKVSDGWYSDELRAGMSYNKESNMYYKIITDEETYKEYKERVNELPESTEIGFDNNFFMLITHGEVQELNLYKKDLTISEIIADDISTHILLEPKENPDYNKARSSLYVIADKTLLRDNITIEIDTSRFNVENNVPIEELPTDYSKENAIKDGCMITERSLPGETILGKYSVISENKNALEELIENSKNGIESYIRIYEDTIESVNIIDIQYKKGIFIIHVGKPGNENTVLYTCKYITKKQIKNDVLYNMSNVDSDDRGAPTLLLVSY